MCDLLSVAIVLKQLQNIKMDKKFNTCFAIFDSSKLDSVEYPGICPRVMKIISAYHHLTRMNKMCVTYPAVVLGGRGSITAPTPIFADIKL